MTSQEQGGLTWSPLLVTQQLEAGVGRAAEFADVAEELQEEAPCLCVFIHWMPRDSRNSSFNDQNSTSGSWRGAAKSNS